MFSGIIEELGVVTGIERERSNLHLTMTCSFTAELSVDQSVSHNGVCLTVVKKDNGSQYTVTAIRETIEKSNLGLLRVGDKVNLERSMTVNGRLDGHIVQGHVDQMAECVGLREADGSWYYTFRYDFDKDKASLGYMTVEKGSVCVNGVSLTVVDSRDDRFSVAIIPFTYHATNFQDIKPGSMVNIEFDILGKYISRLMRFSR